jgi:farnesyl-diphosphate farnesyltransferase
MLSFLRLDEVVAMFRVKYQWANQTVALRDDQEDLKYIYDVLPAVSRSFAMVIIQLHPQLRDAVAIFYLVLRALDTVEDDMAVPVEEKKKIMTTFHERLYESDWSIGGIGEGRERELLEKFPCVSREFQKLKPEYRDVISDITVRMAGGMIHYFDNKVVTLENYDHYCHFVAGLVGHGLTRLFSVSGLEDPAIGKDMTLANSMGLFLQKVNITRDYFEDIIEEPPRAFWPKEIWGQFGETLEEFRLPENQTRGRQCLNAMVANALRHIPDCLDYMATLHEPSVFLFCAIPQIMAIATLAALYNNVSALTVKCKISKGATCKIIVNSTSMPSLLQQFEGFVAQIEDALQEEDPSYDACRRSLQLARERIAFHRATKDAKKTDEAVAAPAPSYARRFLVQYPALGGRMLYQLVDGVRGLLRPSA